MRLNTKLFLCYFAVVVFLFIVVAYFQYHREKQFQVAQLDLHLSDYNQTINRFLEEKSTNKEELEDFLHYLPDSTLRVTIIDTEGKVIFDSYEPNSALKFDNHLHRPEISMSVLSNNMGKAIRHSSTTGQDYYYLVNRFDNYFVRSALPYNLELSKVLRVNTFFLYFLGGIFLLVSIVLFFVTQNITKSIRRLRVFTDKVENGSLPDDDISFPNDELGEISHNIVLLYKDLLAAKEELYKEREKLIQHLQISQEGLGIFSKDKKETLVNSHFIQYANIISDNYSKKSEAIFSTPEFSVINHFIEQSQETNQLDTKRTVVEKGGRFFVIQCIVFQDDSFEVSINDITLQERENELKRHLTQNISHELKTPVSSIMGYMESIIENPDLDAEKQRFFIERAYHQTQRLNALLQDISTLNKIDEAKRLYLKESCNIAYIVNDVINDVQLQLAGKKFIVKQNVSENVSIEGNQSLLYSVFQNLIGNSLTHGGRNLTIEINCYREDEDFYYFSYSDNGIGVDELHLSRLFERFYRVDQGRSRKQGGTGLGLAIVKNAILFHQGTISAKNGPDGGLTFIFSLKKK